MKALKIRKDETIRFNGTHITNGHWMFVRGYNTVSDKSLQSLVDAGIKFSRDRYHNDILTGDEANNFDGARVIPSAMDDDYLIHPSKFTCEIGNDNTLCRIFKHRSGRLVAIDERYAPLWDGRVCFQDKPLNGIRIQDTRDELVAVVMPLNVETLPSLVSSLACDMVPDQE